MTFVLVPLDDRARCVFPFPSEVSYDTYVHYWNIYHGEFCFIYFDFYSGGSVHINEPI